MTTYIKHIEEINIGDGATLSPLSDCFPATVISKTRCTVTVQEDTSTMVKGSAMDGSAEYTYAPNPNGRTFVCRLTKKGWRTPGLRVSFNGRRAYYDPHF